MKKLLKKVVLIVVTMIATSLTTKASSLKPFIKPESGEIQPGTMKDILNGVGNPQQGKWYTSPSTGQKVFIWVSPSYLRSYSGITQDEINQLDWMYSHEAEGLYQNSGVSLSGIPQSFGDFGLAPSGMKHIGVKSQKRIFFKGNCGNVLHRQKTFSPPTVIQGQRIFINVPCLNYTVEMANEIPGQGMYSKDNRFWLYETKWYQNTNGSWVEISCEPKVITNTVYKTEVRYVPAPAPDPGPTYSTMGRVYGWYPNQQPQQTYQSSSRTTFINFALNLAPTLGGIRQPTYYQPYQDYYNTYTVPQQWGTPFDGGNSYTTGGGAPFGGGSGDGSSSSGGPFGGGTVSGVNQRVP